MSEGFESRLFVSLEPQLDVDSSNRVVTLGEPVTMSANAFGPGPLSFQWFLENVAIAGATNGTLHIPKFATNNAGRYRITVSNEFASVSADAGRLLMGSPPEITRHPTNQTVNMGATVSFTVEAIGPGLHRYQWIFDGTNILGANSASLILTNVIPHDSGKISVRVSNPYGEALSQAAGLRVINPARQPPALVAAFSEQEVVSRVFVEEGKTYRILSSTNLVDWEEAGFFLGGAKDFQINSSNRSEPMRFYRVVSP